MSAGSAQVGARCTIGGTSAISGHLEIADDVQRSVIREQVEMGVAVRMACMDLLARNVKAET